MQTASLRLTPTQWLICAIAAIGFAFDIYEILMLPLIVRPALLELTGAAPGSPEFQMWVGRLFYIPAFAGGIFGLLGGYLTDRLGRRRVLTYSILIYAVCGVRLRLRDLDRDAAGAALLRLHRRLRRVRRGGGVAGRALPRAEAPREECSATRRRFRRSAACWSQPSTVCASPTRRSLPAIDAFGVGVPNPHAPWRYTLMSGVHPGDPADPDPAVPARVADLAAEERGRHAEAAEHRRAVLARAAPHDDRDDDDVRDGVRRGVRRDSAGAADRARPAGSAPDDAGPAGAAGARDRTAGRLGRHEGPGDRRARRPRRRSPCSPSHRQPPRS